MTCCNNPNIIFKNNRYMCANCGISEQIQCPNKPKIIPCCDNPEVYYELSINGCVCANCGMIDEEETDNTPNYNQPNGYKVKHHISEVLKQIQCDEPNKPNIDKIKSQLNGDYTLANIYKNCNHKHDIYIYCTLNNIEPPLLTYDQDENIRRSIMNLSWHIKRLPNYRHIIYNICEKYGYNNLKPYLYIKNKNKKLDKKMNAYI
jgi:hypothetical protein